jgi:hypothetical protein
MGISLAMIEKMQKLGLFGKGRISVLDVGSSNLYSAPSEGIRLFLNSYGVAETPEIDAFVARLVNGSAYDAVSGGLNGAFVGELFEKVGIKYNAIDIADGYRTTILDLNHEPAPSNFVNAFDLVLNFGTTEHLLNQYNAFKVMHDATKVGGYIVNSLPCVGYSNHGYFTYTPRCLFDLAGYNEYELVAFWFEGPGGNNDLYAPIRDYLSYFPNLSQTLANREQTRTGQKIAELDLPDVGVVVVYRKVKARPFAGALERSTSVGHVPTSVTSGYESDNAGSPSPMDSARNVDTNYGIDTLGRRVYGLVDRILNRLGLNNTSSNARSKTKADTCTIEHHYEMPLTGKAEEMRNRFILQELNFDECLAFYDLVVEAHGYFPYDWEFLILLRGLERDPSRKDLIERLVVVYSLM